MKPGNFTREQRRSARAILLSKARDRHTKIEEGSDGFSIYETWDNGEGYSSKFISVRPCTVSTPDGRETFYFVHSDYQANDCDGPTSSYVEEEAKVTFTRSAKKTGSVLVPHIQIRELRKRRRDFFAEAMGY